MRTVLESKLQEYARRALIDGLIAYDHGKSFSELVASIELGPDWGVDVSEIMPLNDVLEWQLAAVLELGNNKARIGLRPDLETDGGLSDERIEEALSGPEITWVSKPVENFLKWEMWSMCRLSRAKLGCMHSNRCLRSKAC
ncbi:MAG: hypothetical protein MO846_06510 [Candidatus Devosia symbiotica]|nr:hypothetical protein [Candidatus Devosia symbiotica]